MFDLSPRRVMFMYLGRKGAAAQLTLEVARTAVADERFQTSVMVSRQNENFPAFREIGSALVPVDTFEKSTGALFQLTRVPSLRRRLIARLAADRTEAVIDLMPHVWAPLIAPAIKAANVRYVPIVHDAVAHPGDPTSLVKSFIDRTLTSADIVLTLSEAVAGRLASSSSVPRSKIYTLFHPDFQYGPAEMVAAPAPGEPLRLLFFGRIMAYKGLPVFLDMVDILKSEGYPVEVGVFGEGPLGPNKERLEAMGAEVVNRWLETDEIAAIFSRFHAIVLSHVEASQSGVAAAAFGAGLPVVATPVGGLIEQVVDGQTGTIATRADAPELAEAVKRLLLDPVLYAAVRRNIRRTSGERSMLRFVEDCISHAIYAN